MSRQYGRFSHNGMLSELEVHFVDSQSAWKELLRVGQTLNYHYKPNTLAIIFEKCTGVILNISFFIIKLSYADEISSMFVILFLRFINSTLSCSSNTCICLGMKKVGHSVENSVVSCRKSCNERFLPLLLQRPAREDVLVL